MRFTLNTLPLMVKVEILKVPPAGSKEDGTGGMRNDRTYEYLATVLGPEPVPTYGCQASIDVLHVIDRCSSGHMGGYAIRIKVWVYSHGE